MKQLKIQEKLKRINLPIFTPGEFRDIFNLSDKTARVYLSRNSKTGLFEKLRNNYYLLKDYNVSPFLIANKLYQPSYISLEKALSHFNIIPETIYAITSVTTKPTREFVNNQGLFSYQKIKAKAFTGYNPEIIDGQVILMAEPEKALADYLYFVDLKKIILSDRLNLKDISKIKLSKYLKTFQHPRLNKLIEKIYTHSRKTPTIY